MHWTTVLNKGAVKMCCVSMERCKVKKRKDFQFALREFWLPLTSYYCLPLSFKFRIVTPFGWIWENRSHTHPPLFISECLYDYLLTHRGKQKKQVDCSLWSPLVCALSQNISTHIYFPVCAVVICVFLQVVACYPQKHPSQGKVLSLQSKRTPGLSVWVCESCCIYPPFLWQIHPCAGFLEPCGWRGEEP